MKTKRIKAAIKQLFYKHYWLSYFFSSLLYFRIRKDKQIHETVKQFAGDRLSEKKYIRKLIVRLYANSLTYQILYAEYFLMGFERLNDQGKREFIGDKERYKILKSMSRRSIRTIFDNKYSTYLHYQPFFHRNIIRVASKEDRESFDKFVFTHKKFIVKPTTRSFGRGVFVVQTDATDFSADDLFCTIVDSGEHILEEYITQDPETAKFHPQSVNTLRVSTYFDGNKVTPLFAFFRTGRNDHVVDNGGSGGIFVSVDLATGIACTEGTDELGRRYLLHPDSGVQMIGFRIPRWDEVMDIVDRMARVVPKQRYVGWDLALTSEGWILVEANAKGQFLHQYAERKGSRHLEHILKGK